MENTTYTLIQKSTFTKQQGLTLIEVMIALFVGLLMLAGVMFTYVGMKTTTKDTLALGELQETGRLALNIITSDLEQVGFWGTFYEIGFTPDNTNTLAAPTGDCSAGNNNGSFPDGSASDFTYIYAVTSTGGAQLGCLTASNTGSDILQIKRLQGEETTVGTARTNQYYFIASNNQADFVTPPVAALPTTTSTLWPYVHHVYYVANQTYTLNGSSVSVPALMRRRLTTGGGMVAETVMEGVENLYLTFGLDTNDDGRVDTYRNADLMGEGDWKMQTAKVLTVQVSLLVRALEEDHDLNLINQTYTLGDGTNGRSLPFTDNYRRAVFTSTVQLRNVGDHSWSI